MSQKVTGYNIDLRGIKTAVNPWAWPLMGEKRRYLVLQGGAGSGKSVFAAQKIIMRCITEPGHHFCCFRKIASSVRMSIWLELKNAIRVTGTEELWVDNKTESTMTFTPNGSVVRCLGLDDPEKLKSISGMTGAWLEEATEFFHDDFKQINLRLRGRSKYYKQIIVSFNPINVLHWLKTRFVDQYDRTRDCVVKTTFLDNTFIDDEYSDELRAYEHTDPYVWKVYGLGDWGHSEGLVYPYPLVLPPGAMPPASAFQTVIYGLDWGYNAPTAVLRLLMHPTPSHIHTWYRTLDNPPQWLNEIFGQTGTTLNEELFPKLVFVDTVLYEEKLTTPQIKEGIKRGNIKYWEPIYADPAQPGSIQELVDEGYNVIPAEKGRDSIIGGIRHVKGKKIVTTESNVEFLKEFSLYHWKQNKEKMTDEPVDSFNHALDAMRYALWTYGLETGEILRIGSV